MKLLLLNLYKETTLYSTSVHLLVLKFVNFKIKFFFSNFLLSLSVVPELNRSGSYVVMFAEVRKLKDKQTAMSKTQESWQVLPSDFLSDALMRK